MSRLSSIFADLKSSQRQALIPFITAGDPSVEVTLKAMHALVDAGADVIELGVPYSDPMADGPVIQHASERALANGITLSKVIDLVAEFRQKDTKTGVVLMGYFNPIEAMGYQAFTDRIQAAGVDGVLVVDLPIDESQDLMPELKQANIDPIILLAPTSTPARIAKAMEIGVGYIYYVSFKGITGATGLLNNDEVAAKVNEIRSHGDLSVAVGFGITDGPSAQGIAEFADAVIVGSALVKNFEQSDSDVAIQKAASLLAEIRKAIDERKS